MTNPKRIAFKSAYFASTLRCIYCGFTPLQHNWFVFKPGCPHCQYCYEREVGYYTGASQMFLFPLVIGLGILAGVMGYRWGAHGLLLAGVSSLSMTVGALLLFPWSQAYWMLMDHFFHPLDDEDHHKWQTYENTLKERTLSDSNARPSGSKPDALSN